MICPLTGLACEAQQVRFGGGPETVYQCVQHGGTEFVLLFPDAWARIEAAWAEAQAIIAAARGSEEYGTGG